MQRALRVVFPPRCLSCGDLVEDDFGLCGTCWGETPFLSGLVCDCCGVPLPGDSDRAEFCDDCLTTPPPWHRGRAAMVYADKGRQLVLGLKHGDRQDIARAAGPWMARVCREILPKDPLLVPIPLSRQRLRERRFNQALLLARALAPLIKAEVAPDALIRPVHTAPLETPDRDTRFARLAGAIQPHPRRGALLSGRNVLLIDDVMTSGATLFAATEAAHAAGAHEVCICVLARAVKDA